MLAENYDAFYFLLALPVWAIWLLGTLAGIGGCVVAFTHPEKQARQVKLCKCATLIGVPMGLFGLWNLKSLGGAGIVALLPIVMAGVGWFVGWVLRGNY